MRVQPVNDSYIVSDFIEQSKFVIDNFQNFFFPPVSSSEERISGEINLLNTEKKQLEKERSKNNRNREWNEKKARDMAMERNNEGMERAIRDVVRAEKSDRFLQSQIDGYDRSLVQIRKMKSDQQQTKSKLVVMHATTKLSVSVEDAKHITREYQNMKMMNETLKEMVEDVLSEEADEEENETFDLNDQRRIDELRRRHIEMADSKLMEDIPYVRGLTQNNHHDAYPPGHLSDSEMLIQSKLDEKKLDQFIIGVSSSSSDARISTTVATTTIKK